jgi:hypothetical protein
MDIESITLYLAKRHLGAVAVHAEINNVLGEGTAGYLTMTRYVRKRSFADSPQAHPEELETEESDPINSPILQALDEQPVASLRQLAKKISIPMTTVRYHLVNKMGYKLKRLN